jgi:hypothetical protein
MNVLTVLLEAIGWTGVIYFVVGVTAYLYWRPNTLGYFTPLVDLSAFAGLFCLWQLLVVTGGAARFLLMPRARRQFRLAVLETNFGRDGGWYVEYYGRRIALLTDCRWEDMFWCSYRVELLVDDLEERQRISGEWQYWLGDGVVYRSRQFGEVAPHAFPGGESRPHGERISMRALYLWLTPTKFEEWLVWWRQRKRRR